MLLEPGRGIGACRIDLAVLFMNLVDSHLHQFRCNALAPEIIVYIGVVDRVDTGCVFRKSDLCKDLSVFIFPFDAVGESDIIAHIFLSLQELFIIDRTAPADKFRTAAGTDDRCLSDLFEGNTKGNDHRADMHPDQGSADINAG